jgi:hypothetical protein
LAVSAAERRFILNQLGKRAQEDMVRLWDAAGRTWGGDDEFAEFLIQAFPDLVGEFHQTAAEIAATVFEEDFPDLSPVIAPPLAREQLEKSMQWALGADGTKALDRLSGTMQRAIYNGDRTTTVLSAEGNGLRWIRQARPNACAFCRMLATRTDFNSTYRSAELNPETGEYETRVSGRSVNLSIGDRRMIASGQMTREEALARRDQMQLTYQIGDRKGSPRGRRSRGERKLGDKYHDDCYCIAKAIPVGADVMEVLYLEDPEYATTVDGWLNEYNKARDNSESGDPKKILAEWRTFGADIA